MIKIFQGMSISDVEKAATTFLGADKEATSASIHSYTAGAGRRYFTLTITYKAKAAA